MTLVGSGILQGGVVGGRKCDLTVTGTIAQINGLLNSDVTSILTFTGNVDGNDTPSGVTLSLSINDNGFTDVQVREIESDPINFYYVARK